MRISVALLNTKVNGSVTGTSRKAVNVWRTRISLSSPPVTKCEPSEDISMPLMDPCFDPSSSLIS